MEQETKVEEREKITYKHEDGEKINYFSYKDRTVLVTSQFIADMGFSGYVKTPVGLLLGNSNNLTKRMK